MIGYAKCKDKEELKNFIKNNKKERKYGLVEDRGGWFYNNYDLLGDFYSEYSIKHNRENRGERLINLFDDDTIYNYNIEELISMIETLESENQPLILFDKNEIAGIIGYENDRYILPISLFEVTYLKDYNSIPLSELALLSDEKAVIENLPINISDISRNDLNDEKEKLEKIEKEFENNLSDIKDAKTGELADIQRKIDEMKNELEEKKRNLMAELQSKMDELNIKKKELEDKIFVLDSQIYSIRCYTGEIIKFHQITSGKMSDVNEPLIIYQKIRFIDEELGKYLSIYGTINDENSKTLLDILKHREDIRDLFVPNEKCVTILKSSRTGTKMGSHDLYNNALKSYEQYHGKQIAILIRNGENLYMGWTDTDRVKINDDNVFYSPKKDTYSDVDDIGAAVSSSKYEKVSRLFILNILQGIMDFNKEIINLPDKTNLLKPNNHIVFSTADGWLKNDKYGTFADILKKSEDIKLKAGDYVLTAMRLGRDDGYLTRNERYNNDRGVGVYNRTHDASIKGMTIYPVNIIYYDVTVLYTYEKYACVRETSSKTSSNSICLKRSDKFIGYYEKTDTFDFETWRGYLKKYGSNGKVPMENLLELKNINVKSDYICDENSYGHRIIRRFDRKDDNNNDFAYIDKDDTNEYFWIKPIKAEIVEKKPNYFISVNGSGYWDSTYPVNMQFYLDEVIPLTYLCPTWLKYCITTANVGEYKLCRAYMLYSDMLPYFNIMLAHLNEVSKNEKRYLQDAGLSKWVEENDDWDVMVTEWRIKNKVRKLTEASAKRFAKTLINDK